MKTYLQRLLVPFLLVAIVAAGVIGEVGSDSSAGADGATAQTVSKKKAKKKSQTAKAVKAVTAFERTLSAEQLDTVSYDFGDAVKQSGWSNLPTNAVQRNGLAVSAMSSDQIAALRKMLKTVLSKQGYSDEEAVRAADDYLAAAQGGGGGGQGFGYGSGLYYVAVFGKPSKTKEWTLQFGGHHLAIHLTYKGKKVTGTPYFIGAEPQGGFTVEGKSYEPMKDESGGMVNLFSSLSSTQLAAAKLSETFDDVLLGPGHDDEFPAAQGLSVSDLSKSQQKLLTKAIYAWVGDVDKDSAKKLMKAYEKGYDDTKIAWATSIDPDTQGAYFRIQGPRVWIEIVTQNGVVLSGVHYHSIWRDTRGDYGG